MQICQIPADGLVVRLGRFLRFGEVPGCGLGDVVRQAIFVEARSCVDVGTVVPKAVARALGMPARLAKAVAKVGDVVRQAIFVEPPFCDGLLINWRRRMLRVRPICPVQQQHDEQCSGARPA